MGIGSIQNRILKAPHESTPDVEVDAHPEAYSTKNYVNCLAVCKWMPDGRILPVSVEKSPGVKEPLIFYSVDEYYRWVKTNGPDKTFKDPDGEYIILHKWQPK